MSESLSSIDLELLNLLADSVILTDELYHLQNFQSILNYNPNPNSILLNKDSESFDMFKNDLNLDIWPQLTKRNTRRSSNMDDSSLNNLKSKLLNNINKFIENKFTQNLNNSNKRKLIEKRPIVTKKQKKLPKIKFSISVKPQPILNPNNIPTHKFDSIDELFNSYKNIIEDPAPEIQPSEFSSYIDDQNNLINKIKNAIEDKRLLYIDYNENPFRSVPNGVREPTMIKRNPEYHLSNYKPTENPFRMRNDLTHYDHLLAQGLKSSKLIHNSKINKIQKCKKIAQMIEAYFKRLSQEKEKQEKEYKKKILKLARETAKEVKKKWLVAVKAYKILEEREKEHERMAKSKEQLSKILDHSTKVLGAQLVGKTKLTSANTSSIEPEIESETGSNNSDSDNDDEMLSSSDSEIASIDDTDTHNNNGNEGMDNVNQADDDNKLTVKELKQKYKNLSSVKINNTEENDMSLASLYENGDSQKHNGNGNMGEFEKLTEEERLEIIKQEQADDSLLDENSECSSDSDTDLDSESESIESADSDDEISSDIEKGPTLSSLFTSNGSNSDDENDESVYSGNENNEEETPSSSPDHIIKDDGIPDVPVPILLKGTLRPYQKQGLNWLASLYNNGTNGILADEMGLGKTIQTISLLSYLACEKNIWGPHLIVVPTSVMLNWEMEFKRFAPGFKVLTYYGSPQQRKEKRKGWNTPDKFHVCITSYQLVVHDQPVFRRKKWKYMILDEAHNIKNFRSQRWKSLLNFNTEHRVLLTGTPLQNNIIELWSLLYFLMPSSKENSITMPEGFADLMDFQQWFGKPVDKIIQHGGSDQETKETVNKLHQVLRPYLLRRLKQDVEKQMPAKYEHIVYCRLSKRQRLLYDDFMSRAQTKETLASGNFLSIINCLMQLRKVCNHPDLFEVRPILTSFAQEKSVISNFLIEDKIITDYLKKDKFATVDLNFLNLVSDFKTSDLTASHHYNTISKISASKVFDNKIKELEQELHDKTIIPNFNNLEEYYTFILNKENRDLLEMMKYRKYVNDFKCNKKQLVSQTLIQTLKINNDESYRGQLLELGLVSTVTARSFKLKDTIEKYAFITPKVICQDMNDLLYTDKMQNEFIHDSQYDIIQNPFHQIQVKSSIAFPDKSLLQYDCGKLQKLAQILHDIIPQGHRVLIFTQMSKVLDILELFLNYHGYTYMRLDGATKIEDRQLLTERFNNDSRVKCFILSTRAGGLGINLTGADTVIFYDSDWNPAIDKQCQDRCHRIGQTRDVHIYRFVSEYTIEDNILKKAEQKKHLDNVIIQKGDFTTDYFNKVTVSELLGQSTDIEDIKDKKLLNNEKEFTRALEQAEDDDDAKAAEMAMRETNVDVEDFSDDEKQTSVQENKESNMNSDAKSSSPAEKENMNSDVDSLALQMVGRNETLLGTKEATQAPKEDEVEKEKENEYEKVENDSDAEEDDDDDIGHIDEYMIRFIAGGYYFD